MICFLAIFNVNQWRAQTMNFPVSFTEYLKSTVTPSQITIGNIMNLRVGNLTYMAQEDTSVPLSVIIPAVVVPVAAIFICCVVSIVVIILVASRVSKKKERQYTSLIAKMELLEYEMADECKRGE